jgi:hypothetical protein
VRKGRVGLRELDGMRAERTLGFVTEREGGARVQTRPVWRV